MSDAECESRLRQLGQPSGWMDDNSSTFVLDCPEGQALVLVRPNGRVLFGLFDNEDAIVGHDAS
jgi:hypothetical protein